MLIFYYSAFPFAIYCYIVSNLFRFPSNALAFDQNFEIRRKTFSVNQILWTGFVEMHSSNPSLISLRLTICMR